MIHLGLLVNGMIHEMGFVEQNWLLAAVFCIWSAFLARDEWLQIFGAWHLEEMKY